MIFLRIGSFKKEYILPIKIFSNKSPFLVRKLHQKALLTQTIRRDKEITGEERNIREEHTVYLPRHDPTGFDLLIQAMFYGKMAAIQPLIEKAYESPSKTMPPCIWRMVQYTKDDAYFDVAPYIAMVAIAEIFEIRDRQVFGA